MTEAVPPRRLFETLSGFVSKFSHAIDQIYDRTFFAEIDCGVI
jgi:hypothetical protein